MKTFIAFAAFTAFGLICYGQSVTTFHANTTQKIDDAMALDAKGNLYGSHFNGSNVYKISTDGTTSIFASGFNTPNGLAFDSNQNLYVCDLSANRIYIINPDGQFLDTIQTNGPSGIIKSPDSDIMIFTQYPGNDINQLAPDGTITTLISDSLLNGPVGLAFDDQKQLYIGNFTDRKIFKAQGNELVYVALVPGSASGWLGFITYSQGSLWGTSFKDHKIYRIHQQFTDSVELIAGSTAGSTDGDFSTAKFSSPNGIIPSVSGDSLYISDYGTGKIRVIDLSKLVEVPTFTIGEHTITAYPNPFQTMIQFQTEQTIDLIQLYSLSGQLLLETKGDSLDTEMINPGVYILKTRIADHYFSHKVIKSE